MQKSWAKFLFINIDVHGRDKETGNYTSLEMHHSVTLLYFNLDVFEYFHLFFVNVFRCNSSSQTTQTTTHAAPTSTGNVKKLCKGMTEILFDGHNFVRWMYWGRGGGQTLYTPHVWCDYSANFSRYLRNLVFSTFTLNNCFPGGSWKPPLY